MSRAEIALQPNFGQSLAMPVRDPAWGRDAPVRQIPFVPNLAPGADPRNTWGAGAYNPLDLVDSPWSTIVPLSLGAMAGEIIPALAFLAAGKPPCCQGCADRPASMSHAAGAPFFGSQASGPQIVGLATPLDAAKRVVHGARRGDARALRFVHKTVAGAAMGNPDAQATQAVLAQAARHADRDAHTARYLGIARQRHVQRMGGAATGRAPMGYGHDGQPLYGLPATYGTLYQ